MPTRLNAILLVPVVIALVFGSIQVNSQIQTWREAEDARKVAELVAAAADYGHALIDERDRTAVPLLTGEKDDPVIAKVRNTTDKAAEVFHDAVDRMPDQDGLKRRLAVFMEQEPKLGKLREHAYTARMGGIETHEGYVTIQHPLMEFANELGLGTGNVTSFGRTVYAISLAKAAESLQRSIGLHLLVDPGPGAKDKKAQLTAFASYAYLERLALIEYTSGGRPEDLTLLKRETAAGERNARQLHANAREEAEAEGEKFVTPPSLKKMGEAIASGASPSTLRGQGITQDSWMDAATAKFDAYREVEERHSRDAFEETKQIASDAKRDAIVNGAVGIAALLAAFVLAGKMARSMSRSMRGLRGAALEVAEQRLPALVDQLSRTEPGRVDTRVKPIPIGTRDEIGEVARAFDQVHREAVRLAAEQALLRGNVNAIFTNLSRRNQGLIERQLDLITQLENSESDPDQLHSLFRMDHLATRMRRNGENLLVLAGEEPGRRWTQPVPLVDVLRAATSEVEQYERIDISGVPESEIHGRVVNDLVHLLAELLENAASFSSPQTKVRVTATRLPDGRVMIEIHDKGIGLTSEDFADINHKLAHPPTVDVSVSQRMGLFVVGRLAARHGIRVQLRPSGEQGGTTSLVMLPENITQGGGGSGFTEEVDGDITVSRVMESPTAPGAPEQHPGAPALEGPEARAGERRAPGRLDPIGRSLMREERLAALEGQHGPDEPYFGSPQGAADPGPEAPVPGPALPAGGGYDPVDPTGTGQFPVPGHQEGYAPAGPAPHDPAGADPFGQAFPDAPAQPVGYGGVFGPGDGAPEPGPGWWADRDEPAGQAQAPLGEERSVWDAPAPRVEAEPAVGGPQPPSDGVGFDRPGPHPSSYHSTTGVGLPRREPGQSHLGGGPEGPADSGPESAESPEAAGGFRAANDDRWERAGRLRAPQAGGVTTSGLPRRVPRANLVEGVAEESAQGGPSVSRAPEDVRGRLSNLHRGVRRGRGAGGSVRNDRQGFGPGSTYDQER
nr:nitrate- and nitrite sensing domain-containing protein [Streptomyces sp. AJS327]